MTDKIKKCLIAGYDIDIITKEEMDNLWNYITNLQEKVKQYEEPNDMTLFYMWLDEKAKDKMKQLEKENQRLKENNQNMQVEMARSWERIDKAIEFINKLQENDDIEIWREDGYYAYILYILRGEDKQ